MYGANFHHLKLFKFRFIILIMVETKYDYEKDFDVLHIYNSDIDNGIRGGLSYGNFNIDIGINGEIVAIEIEGASSILNLSPEILDDLDSVIIVVKRLNGSFFAGVNVLKDQQSSMVQIGIPIEDMRQFEVLTPHSEKSYSS